MNRCAGLLSIAVLLVTFAAAEKKKVRQEFIRPNQVFEIADAASKFATAARGCANDGWAAAVASVLEVQGLKLPMKDWSVKLAGGDGCLQTTPAIDALRKSVEGDYSLGNGRHVRISLNVSPGTPRAADPLGAQLAAGQPLIVIYKGRPLVLYGMTYDEHIINNLRRELWITELRLVDPAAKPGTEQRTLAIKREGDDAQNIEAMIQIKVTEMGYMQLETH